MEKDLAIKVTHVSKDFKLYYDKAHTLKEKLLFFSHKNKNKDMKEVLLTVLIMDATSSSFETSPPNVSA